MSKTYSNSCFIGASLGLKAIELARDNVPDNHTVAPSEMLKVLTLVYSNMDECEAKEELTKKWRLSLPALAAIEKLLTKPFSRAAVIYVNGCSFNMNAKALKTQFNATFQPQLDVAGANKFVRETTKGEIDSILEDGDIDRQTRFVILSTSHFLGEWRYKFNRTMRGSTFKSTIGTYTGVDYMQRTFSPGQYTILCGEEVLALPYKGGEYAACFAKMQLSAEDIMAAAEELHSYGFGRREDGMRRKLLASVPKFKISSETDIKTMLCDMDVKQMFNTMEWGGAKSVYVYKFLQKATCEIDEEKTVAASATVAVGKTRSIGFNQPIIMKFNSSFFFFVVHIETGAIVSLSWVNKPLTGELSPPKLRGSEKLVFRPGSSPNGRSVVAVPGSKAEARYLARMNAVVKIECPEEEFKKMAITKKWEVNCDFCDATHINKNRAFFRHLEDGNDMCEKCADGKRSAPKGMYTFTLKDIKHKIGMPKERLDSIIYFHGHLTFDDFDSEFALNKAIGEIQHECYATAIALLNSGKAEDMRKRLTGVHLDLFDVLLGYAGFPVDKEPEKEPEKEAVQGSEQGAIKENNSLGSFFGASRLCCLSRRLDRECDASCAFQSSKIKCAFQTPPKVGPLDLMDVEIIKAHKRENKDEKRSVEEIIKAYSVDNDDVPLVRRKRKREEAPEPTKKRHGGLLDRFFGH